MTKPENKPENRNEQIKSVKEIDSFVKEKVNPMIVVISDARRIITETRAKLNAIKALRNDTKPQETADVVVEKATTPEVSVENPVVESDNKPKENASEQQANSTPVKEVEQKTTNTTTPSEKPVTRTYINPQAIKPDYRNNKPNQGNIDVSAFARNNRSGAPRGGNAQSGGVRSNFQNKPNTGNAGARPTRIEPIDFPTTGRGDKKKKQASFVRNEKTDRGGFSKRDLFKKGYAVDGSLLEDNEMSRYVKVKKKNKDNDASAQRIKIDHAVLNSEIVSIRVLSEKIGVTAKDIINKLFQLGKIVTINGNISFEEAEMIAIDYNIELELKKEASAEDKLKELVNQDVDTANLVKRPPVVTIMGHVDHGKTSLLDYIRKTNVVAKEAGGITQHIGAYTIDVNGEKITFLDTPGHEAFTAMRMRGAKVTDIAVIVVAADDGIKPQTVEAINHAKEAGVVIMIAINKIDKPAANVDRVKQELTQYDLMCEEWGGDVMVCPISAKYGQGVQELLEGILLQADVLELKANKNTKANGTIIEARLDKGIGPVATVLVQNGTLKVKDYVVAGTTIGKVRAMTDYQGKQVKEAGPSYAVQIQGFSEVPNAGDIMVAVADEKLAKQVVQDRIDKERSEMQAASTARSLDDMFKNVTSDEVKMLSLLIKADVQGSAEAIKQSMLKLSEEMQNENVKIHIVHSGVGAINESDVMLAGTTKAVIIGFNVRPDAKARALAENTGVDIRNYSIIYDAIDDVTAALKGMFTPKYNEVIIGHAEVRAVFKISNYGTVAGSYITDGKVSRNCGARLLRDNVVIFEGTLSSLKRGKDDAKDVAAGYECGIGLERFNDIKVGDIIESYIMEKIEQ
ncbi:MAG: translation initiation factor IF-2 [Christensenellales bacterium]